MPDPDERQIKEDNLAAALEERLQAIEAIKQQKGGATLHSPVVDFTPAVHQLLTDIHFFLHELYLDMQARRLG